MKRGSLSGEDAVELSPQVSIKGPCMFVHPHARMRVRRRAYEQVVYLGRKILAVAHVSMRNTCIHLSKRMHAFFTPC